MSILAFTEKPFISLEPDSEVERQLGHKSGVEAVSAPLCILFTCPGSRAQTLASMIRELFEHLVMHPESLPDDYRELSNGEPAHRTVCDYIAGMTDGFFHRTYDQYFGSSPSG